MIRTNDKPHICDHEAECALLGSMLLDPRVIGDVMQVVEASDLFSERHAVIYESIATAYDKNEKTDLVQIHSRMAERGVLGGAGGKDYLLELAESVPSAASATYYAKIVADLSRKRKLLAAIDKISQQAQMGDGIDDLIDRAEAAIYEVSDKRGSDEPEAAGAVLQDAYDLLQDRDGDGRGVETGFIELDEMTLGLHPGQLVIVAARPSMGKTAFCLQIAHHAATKHNTPVAVFSMEMSKPEVGVRLMSLESGVGLQTIRKLGGMTGEMYERLALAVGRMTNAPLMIDDRPGLTLMQLRASARRLIHRHGTKLIIVDYLQLMVHRAESRVQEVSALSRGLKTLARELRVPVVCLSQLNRKAEARTNNRPMMSDLRESGSIEQDADVVILLHREDYYHKGDPQYAETNLATVIVEKQRQGPTGAVELVWSGETASFRNKAFVSCETNWLKPPKTTATTSTATMQS